MKRLAVVATGTLISLLSLAAFGETCSVGENCGPYDYQRARLRTTSMENVKQGEWLQCSAADTTSVANANHIAMGFSGATGGTVFNYSPSADGTFSQPYYIQLVSGATVATVELAISYSKNFDNAPTTVKSFSFVCRKAGSIPTGHVLKKSF